MSLIQQLSRRERERERELKNVPNKIMRKYDHESEVVKERESILKWCQKIRHVHAATAASKLPLLLLLTSKLLLLLLLLTLSLCLHVNSTHSYDI